MSEIANTNFKKCLKSFIAWSTLIIIKNLVYKKICFEKLRK